ncbi:MAG: hypothetical protein HONBIEJF_00103 [Fimbriimonadaceae bacterium]|nr:hypothetical protein [Fimbriimonadaceae bacterium]
MNLRFENLLLAALSIASAVFLWLHVQAREEPGKERELMVKVDIAGLKADFVVTKAPATVPVVAEGSQEALNLIDSESLSATLDLSNAKVGDNRVPVQLRAPARANVSFSLRRIVERIEVARVLRTERTVEIETFGVMPPGLMFGDASSDPESVVLIGPEKVVPNVLKVRAMLDLSKLRPGMSYPIAVEVLGSSNQPVKLVRAEPSIVTVRPAVLAAPATKRVLVTPILKGQPAVGYRVASYEVSPNQVSVTGNSSALNRMATIDTEAANLSGLTTDTSLSVRLRLPTGIKIQGSRMITIRVKIEPIPAPQATPLNP